MTAPLAGWQRLFLALLSGVLVAIPFLSPMYYWITWVAFVPLLLAIEQISLRASYGLGLASGLIFSIIAGYWITDFLVIAKGYGMAPSMLLAGIFWLFSAQITALIAVALNGLRRWSQRCLSFPVHDFVLFPLVLASAYSVIPMLFPFHPANTQSRFLSALQAIEFTRLYGLDALIALVNIMVYRVLAGRFRHPIPPLNTALSVSKVWVPWGLSSFIVMSWFVYGAAVTRAWDQQLATWATVTVGIVQPNEAPSLARPAIFPGYSLAYPPEMAMTERLAQAGAELVVWPETRYKGYFDQPHVQNAYADRLAEAGVALLFQDAEQVAHRKTGQTTRRSDQYHSDQYHSDQYNSAVMIRSDGQPLAHYRKMKTMPFGESVPLAETFPILKSATNGVLAGFNTSLQRGTEHAAFNLGALTVIPLICYETLFPSFVQSAVPPQTQGTVLIGLSNNGWFGDTVQPYQHMNASILRAVENRLPFVHVMNNGPSVVVLPNGRVLFQSQFREAGGYLVDVPYLRPGSKPLE